VRTLASYLSVEVLEAQVLQLLVSVVWFLFPVVLDARPLLVARAVARVAADLQVLDPLVEEVHL
jgi:hypothetical protein